MSGLSYTQKRDGAGWAKQYYAERHVQESECGAAGWTCDLHSAIRFLPWGHDGCRIALGLEQNIPAAGAPNNFRRRGLAVRRHGASPEEHATSSEGIVFPAARSVADPYMPLSAVKLDPGCMEHFLARVPSGDETIVKGIGKLRASRATRH